MSVDKIRMNILAFLRLNPYYPMSNLKEKFDENVILDLKEHDFIKIIKVSSQNFVLITEEGLNRYCYNSQNLPICKDISTKKTRPFNNY
jgi:hypothetical protein